MQKELGRYVDFDEVKENVKQNFEKAFDAELRVEREKEEKENNSNISTVL